MTHKILIASLMLTGLVAASCATTPEPVVVEEEVVVVVAPPVRTCTPISMLEKIVIPAEVRRGFSSTSVEDNPEYYTDPETGEVSELPSQSTGERIPFETIITPEKILYVNAENRVITDICDDEGQDGFIPE